MANFTYIENAHVFSKAPVQLNMEASSAVNKSVHTVQSNEIWGEVCPFITKESVKDLKEDTLFEIDGYAPVKFNYKKPAIVLDAINNNGMKSNGYVAKVIIDNKPITQFIADTDVTDATGKLAAGYRAVLYDKTGGEVADSKYTINYSNGLIYFKEPIESTLDSHYTLSFFTYEGAKLDTTITNIKSSLSSHTSDTDIHITADERSKWNTASQKTDRLSFPTSYTNFNDNQCYVTSYGFEYKELIEDAWIQNIEVNVALPELRDSIAEYNPIPGGSPITPNTIGEKVCKILVVEGLTDRYINDGKSPDFDKNIDETVLGASEYNICKKDKNNSLIEILNFTFDQPIFLKANKNYRFYFYGRNGNLYALPIIVNVDDSNNVTTIKKEVAIRCLIDRYDYTGVWNIDKDLLPDPYGLYGLKVKLSKDIYSAFIAHENNNDVHVTKTERNNWNNSWENAISEEKYTITEYDKISGDYTTFVLPYNIVPVGSSINTVKLEITKGSPGASAYLGAGLLSTDGSIKLLRVSNNAESISSSGILTWYFDEALELEENSRFVFYLLKNKEDFISPHPLVSSDVRICSRAARVVPGSDYSSWDNVISNLNYGFISNAANLEAGNYNSMWDEYPVCTLSKIHHVNNDIRHFKEGEHEQLFSDDGRLFATTEEVSILEENINDINNEIETFNYDLAQSVETGVVNNTVNNTRGFATLITDNITLAKVITYCHPSGGAENSNIWLKVFEKTTAPHIFKGISDTSLNHAHGSSLEYTFKNSDIKLEANKEYFFVFCPDSQKSSTIFNTASDSIDCCIKAVPNTTGHGGMLGANAVTQQGIMALHKIYKKLGKFAFAFASDLEEHVDNFNNHVGDSTHITDAERTKWNSALYTITGSDYINISTDASKTISVTNIAESISDNTSDSLVTESSVIKYVDDTKDENGEIIEQGLLTKWHIENEYFHMQKSVADSLKSFNLDNYGLGDTCKGIIMNLPYLSKIKSISLVAVTASEYNQPLPEKAMTWSNYRLQIVDTLSGQVLATSEIGKNANTSANTASKGYPIGLFDFVNSYDENQKLVINQIYCDAKRDYQILFVNEAGETVNIHLAYANGNGSSATYENYTFGELAPKVILPDGTIKEHPLSFSVALQPALECKGYACDFAVDTVKSEELTHLSKQIGELKNYIAYMNASINQLKS